MSTPFNPQPLPQQPGPGLPGAADIVTAHDQWLTAAGWPGDGVNDPGPGTHPVWAWICRNHEFNTRLWREEDLARRTRVSDADIAANKRAIDRFNQARNDATERMDEALLMALGLVDPGSVGSDSPQALVGAGARLNSETAGSMIDRLSILALKVAAMREQTRRVDVGADHLLASRGRLARLEQQRADLAGCLDRLIEDARAGCAYFKVYRQFKMYNDPRFNPALVAERAGGP